MPVEREGAIRTELERVRQKIEQPGGGGQNPGGEPSEPEDPQLVGFAEEVQLLKRLEEDLRDRLRGFRARREALSSAGFELDGDDLAEIDELVARQSDLRRVFEAVLARLEESGSSSGSEAF